MAGGAPFFFNSPKVSNVTIVAADASALKTLVTAPAGGSKVVALNLASDDTSARVVQFGVTQSGGSFYPIGSVNVPAASGTDGTAVSVNAMNSTSVPSLPVDSDGNPYILLESGDKLEIKSLTTVTAAKTISATAIHADAV